MLNQKRFGRKLSISSTMKIERDLIDMTHADTVVTSFKGRGVTRDEFKQWFRAWSLTICFLPIALRY